jgi:hypothetical protein
MGFWLLDRTVKSQAKYTATCQAAASWISSVMVGREGLHILKCDNGIDGFVFLAYSASIMNPLIHEKVTL